MRGVDRRIPTVERTRHVIYVRDEAPDDFAYTLAKALDEHQDLLRMQAQPYWYDPKLVRDAERCGPLTSRRVEVLSRTGIHPLIR